MSSLIKVIENNTMMATVISGVLVYVLSQLYMEYYMSPRKKYRELKEKIAYIGQGRFGVLYYENPRDQRKFTIKKIIEWEDREKNSDWRDELSGLYSKVE